MQKINLPQGQKQRLYLQESTHQKGKKVTQKTRKESSDTEGQKAQFTQNPQTKPHTVIKNKNKKNNKKRQKKIKNSKKKSKNQKSKKNQKFDCLII